MRIYTSSLGCKLNQSEMDALAEKLARAGHHIVTSPLEAELCVLNTCAVTHVAARKSRQALRRLHRQSSEARLVVTGCYAELAPGDLRDLPGVEVVAGNRYKDGLAELVNDLEPGTSSSSLHHNGHLKLPEAVDFPSGRRRTRALLKIQDGCDNACTYCIIHVARGPQISREPDEILGEVRAKLAAGHKEIVLTGVHIGAYGRDRGGLTTGGAPGKRPSMDLWGLVRSILEHTDVPRLRLSSIEPWDLAERAFVLWENPRLCRHLHLPLQSGCGATLRRMARHYSPAGYAALLEQARAAIPDLAVTTDVIVGFPGETAQAFSESLAFVRAMGFARVHVFPYSPRPGTSAAQMRDQVPQHVKSSRSREMRAAAAASARIFHERFIGRTMSVLWESSRPGGDGCIWHGLTDNYLRVQALSTSDRENSLTPTRLIAWADGSLRGEIEDQKSGGGI